MNSLEFARESVAETLRVFELPRALDLGVAPDDDEANGFARHYVGRAGPVELDLIVTAQAAAPGHWTAASVSITSEFSLWQSHVQKKRDDSMRVFICHRPWP